MRVGVGAGVRVRVGVRGRGLHLAALEGVEGALPHPLVLVAVHGGGGAAQVGEVRRQGVGGALGVDEDDGLAAYRLEQVRVRG